MIRTQKHSLSDGDKGTLRDWFASNSFQLLMQVLRSEQAYVQAEAGAYHISIERKVDPEEKERHRQKMVYLTNRADDLQFMIEHLEMMSGKDYEFQTATLTP